jgi:hypothetical protein
LFLVYVFKFVRQSYKLYMCEPYVTRHINTVIQFVSNTQEHILNNHNSCCYDALL